MALYLVTGKYVETGALLPPQQVVHVVENMALPSFEIMAKLQDEKKILAGGLLTGARAGAFIVDAESNHEVSRMLMELPMWGVVTWEVQPLDSFRERHAQERKVIDRLKQQIK
jgi:hypothetical protein